MSNLNEGYLFVIGDVHSCVDELKSLIEKCKEYAADKPYKFGFVGDLFHKGPYAVGVASVIINLAIFDRLAFIVKGNHEELVMHSPKNETDRYCGRVLADPEINKYLVPAISMNSGGNYHLFLHGGLCKTSISLLDHIDEIDGLDNAREFFKSLSNKDKKTYKRINRVIRVDQNGKFLGFNANDIQPGNWQEWFVRNCSAYIFRGASRTLRVVHGHEPCESINAVYSAYSNGSTFGIDTGCCHGNKLTALAFYDGDIDISFDVKAKEKYAPSLAPMRKGGIKALPRF